MSAVPTSEAADPTGAPVAQGATDVAVVVVGAGPVGLSAAALLGRAGLSVVVLERRTGINPHPRARSVNVRTAEIFRGMGLLDDIEAVSLPPEWGERFVYAETLAGREIGRTTMNVQPVVDGRVLSPAPWLLSSQDRIEPVIARHGAAFPGVELWWGHEFVDLDADAEGVTVLVRPAGGGTAGRRTVRASWMIAADGAASPVRRRLGVPMEGGHDLATLVNCRFRADLSRFTDHRPAALYWTTGEDSRNVFQKIDTDGSWLCQLGYDPRRHRPEDFDRDTARAWILRSIGAEDPAVVAEIGLDVLDVIPWTMSSTVAATMRVGRVFLAGDAAHQLPPSGGFGMNTGVQDAHNLAWKLALVHRGLAGDGLLDTYDTERRPVARYNADRSLENTRQVGRIRKLMESGRPDEAAAAVASSARYGNWLGMDLGLHYEAGCLVPDGTEPPVVDDPVSHYEPCARPGHRAPHLDVVHGGHVCSTLDLFADAFVLLAGPEGAAWCDAASALGDPVLRALRFGADLLPVPGAPVAVHADQYGIGASGAVLVRPDGHVAWRHPGPPPDGAAVGRLLAGLMDALLDRDPLIADVTSG